MEFQLRRKLLETIRIKFESATNFMLINKYFPHKKNDGGKN